MASVIDTIIASLPCEPRYSDNGKPGFWTDGTDILCPTENACEAVADFLQDMLKDSNLDIHTGYYDPEEDVRNNEQDDRTGFFYISYD